MNPELTMTLDDCVAEVLGQLTGLDLGYNPEFDRYRTVTRSLNRALRAITLDAEWSYYSSEESVGTVAAGDTSANLRSSLRPRVINDDAVRLKTPDGRTVMWGYFLPRDAIHKYQHREGFWVSTTRTLLQFSRPIAQHEAGLELFVPVMREPRGFKLPLPPESDSDPFVPIPQSVRDQLLDFDYPDLVIAKAAFFYAQSDPIMQPRIMTLEQQYKDLMYALVERDERATDIPYQNDFMVPIQSSLGDSNRAQPWHGHPHSDERR